MPTVTRSLMIAIFAVALAMFATGCAHVPPPDHIVKVAVLDARMDQDASTDQQTKAGWWMGTRDRFESASVGPYIAEAVGRELGRIPGVEIYSPMDLHTFLAQKERVVRRAYPDLTPDERLQLLRDQNPVDFGRSLNVDYVVSGQVHEARTLHNRTFHWWQSRVDLTLEVWDVSSGKLAWSWSDADSSLFHSTVDVIDDLARDAAHHADKQDAFKFYQVPASMASTDPLLRRGD